MLAHNAEELQRKLHLDSSGFCLTSDLALDQSQDLLEFPDTPDTSEFDCTQLYPEPVEPGPAADLSSTQLSKSCTTDVTELTSNPSPDRSSTPQQPLFESVKEQRDEAVATKMPLKEDS